MKHPDDFFDALVAGYEPSPEELIYCTNAVIELLEGLDFGKVKNIIVDADTIRLATLATVHLGLNLTVSPLCVKNAKKSMADTDGKLVWHPMLFGEPRAYARVEVEFFPPEKGGEI